MSTAIMDADTLVKEVCAWAHEHCEEAGISGIEIAPDTDLLGSGALDSLGFIDLIAFIEEAVGVELDLMEIEPDAFSRVQGLCEFALSART
jgi:acyl carrier protein